MDLWKQVIKALSERPTRFPHLRPAFLAQWMLETGKGTSRGFRDYLNVAGMMWRPEMKGYAEKTWYATDTEPFRNGPNGWERGNWFCRFDSPEAAVEGYFHFLSRSPYHGWELHTATAADFLSFIGKTWCPAGYRDEWMSEHGGRNYHEHILHELYPEALELLKDLTEVPEGVPQTATWLEANRTEDGVAVVSARTSTGACLSNLRGSPSISKQDLREFADFFSQARTLLVAKVGEKPIPTAPTWPKYETGNAPEPSSQKLKGISILLDPGHSPAAPGAHGRAPDKPGEYEMNLLQARVLADRLRAEGAEVTIYDPDPDNLERVALQAHGKNLYLALHHNAANANGDDEGTETHIHPLATTECGSLARLINDRIAESLGTKNRGVKKTAYTVLSVATRSTNCKLNILTESYFIDDYGRLKITSVRSRTAAHAIADAVIEYFDSGRDSGEPDTRDHEVLEPWEGVREFDRDYDVWLSKNFHLSEMRCRCGCQKVKVNGKHIQRLQEFRDEFNRPIRINSGYRCPEYNKKIGGASQSRHMYGDATDITVEDISPEDVAHEAESLFDGIGRYNTFTHVDSRGYPARWRG